MKRQDIILEDWQKYEWIQIHPFEYIRGLEATEPPPAPQDGFAYELKDITTASDNKRQWKWVRVIEVTK